MNSQDFYALFSQVGFFIAQSATFTFFRNLFPAISHLSKLGRSTEKFKEDLISSKAFFTEFYFFKKNVVSSA